MIFLNYQNTLKRTISGAILIANQDNLDNTVFESNKTYLFRRGEQFLLSVTVSADITIGAYGTGSNPVLKGSIDISQETWVSEGNGVYSITPLQPPKWLYITGQNAKCAETDWITITSIPGPTRVGFADESLNSVNPLGAKIVCFETAFRLSKEFEVTDYQSGVITVDREHTFGLLTNIGQPQKFKLISKREYIQNDFEWAFDGVLYVKLPLPPENYEINIVTENYGVNALSTDIEIKDIEFKHYFIAAITGSSCNNLYVHDCEINNCREDGIRISDNTDGLSIVNNTIAEVGVAGIALGRVQNPIIENNTVYNIGTQPNYGWMKEALRTSVCGVGIHIGIDIFDSSNYAYNWKINNNKIYNTAYNGISIHAGDKGQINNNVVHDFLTRFQDGGGIYTFNYRPRNAVMSDVEIANNIVYNYPNVWSSCGIYQDNRSGINNIHHNVVFGGGRYALFVNNGTTGTIIEDNILIDAEYYCCNIAAVSDGTIGPSENLKFNRNIVASRKPLVECMKYSGNFFAPNGGADDNIYINPYSDKIYDNQKTLSQLRSELGEDSNSIAKVNWLTYVDEATALEHVKLYTNETNSDIQVTIPIGYEDVDGVDRSGQTMTVPAYYGLLLLKSAD